MNRFIAIAVGLALCPAAAGNPGVVPGERVPALENLHWIRGDPVDRFETGRVYVLEFWSTWCGACTESIQALNELARTFHADVTFIAIHIWQKDSAPKPLEFIENRLDAGQAIMEFPISVDVDGGTARAWMDATENLGLPTAMIVDRASRLAWFGHARDLEGPLKEIVGGSWDLARASAEMHRRIRVGRLAAKSDSAIEKGDYERGITLILEALDADPKTAAEWIPSTYGHLLAATRSPEVAAEFARKILATDAGKKEDLLAGLAHAIFHFRPKELRNLNFALMLAERAGAIENPTDPHVFSLAANLRAELGGVSEAVRDLERAINDAPNEIARKILAKTLEDLRSSQRQVPAGSPSAGESAE